MKPTHFLATERLLPPITPFTGVPRYRSTVYPKRRHALRGLDWLLTAINRVAPVQEAA